MKKKVCKKVTSFKKNRIVKKYFFFKTVKNYAKDKR